MKKIIVMILSIVLVLVSLLSGCSSKSSIPEATSTAATSTLTSTDSTSARQPLDISKYSTSVDLKIPIRTSPATKFIPGDSYINNTWTHAWKTDMNINVIPMWQAVNNGAVGSPYEMKLNLAIASNQLPDVMLLANYSQFDRLQKAGRLEDLTSYYNKYASDFIKANVMADGGEAISWGKVNGELYGFPSKGVQYQTNRMIYIRHDWFVKSGLAAREEMNCLLKNLTSRERVEIALEHKEPDRVPCDLTISPDAYAVLCDYLNCKYEPYWWDDCNHAFPSIEVLEKLGVDIYHIPAVNFVPKDFSTDKTEFKDQWGNTKRKIKDSNESFMYVSVDNPLKDAETVDDILSYSWPSPEEIVNFDGLEEMVKHIYKETNMAITATVGGHVFEQPHFLRGFENFLVDLCINEEIACALMDKVLEINLSVEKLIFKTIGKYLTYIRFNGEDMGTQNSPLISQEIFTKLIKPRQQKEWRFAKSEFVKYNPLGKICVHSCGAVLDFIPHFIEMGIDMLNPIQPNAHGMDTKLIKQKFGDKLSFHGGIDSQNILANGSEEDVINEVKTRLKHLATGGGYLAAPSHNIQYGMPPQNVVAMYEAIHKYGTYPINIK